MKKYIIILFLISVNAYAEPEKYYQQKYCKGVMEFVLPDKTRVDCLTKTHAIEYDFGKKWAEAIGQALHYAMWTGRKGGIVLIISPSEKRFLDRVKNEIDHYGLPIDVWSVVK